MGAHNLDLVGSTKLANSSEQSIVTFENVSSSALKYLKILTKVCVSSLSWYTIKGATNFSFVRTLNALTFTAEMLHIPKVSRHEARVWRIENEGLGSWGGTPPKQQKTSVKMGGVLGGDPPENS